METLEISDGELIDIAAGVVKRHAAKDRVFGDVGAALLSETGSVTPASASIPQVGDFVLNEVPWRA